MQNCCYGYLYCVPLITCLKLFKVSMYIIDF